MKKGSEIFNTRDDNELHRLIESEAEKEKTGLVPFPNLKEKYYEKIFSKSSIEYSISMWGRIWIYGEPIFIKEKKGEGYYIIGHQGDYPESDSEGDMIIYRSGKGIFSQIMYKNDIEGPTTEENQESVQKRGKGFFTRLVIRILNRINPLHSPYYLEENFLSNTLTELLEHLLKSKYTLKYADLYTNQQVKSVPPPKS